MKSIIQIGKKNVFIAGNVYGNITIESENEIPLDLNSIPEINFQNLVGRQKDFLKLEDLIKSNSKVQLLGVGGIGKTSLAQYFAKQFKKDTYHRVWISCESSLELSFIQNTQLIDSLRLTKQVKERITEGEFREAFELIINRLRQLSSFDQKNLLIIDNVSPEIQSTVNLELLSLGESWTIVVTTREKLIDFKPYVVKELSLEHLTRIFYIYYDREKNDEYVKEVIELLSHHTLLVELYSKTIQEQRHLKLGSLIELLKNEGVLFENSPEIATTYNKVNVYSHIDKCLKIAFDFSDLSNDFGELDLLRYFSIFPNLPVRYDELIDLLSIENQKEFNISVNKLISKGWLSENSVGISCHNLIQDISRTKLNPNSLNSLNYLLKLKWVSSENIERNSNIARVFPFCESVLKHVKPTNIQLIHIAQNLGNLYSQIGMLKEGIAIKEKNKEYLHNLTSDSIGEELEIICNDEKLSSIANQGFRTTINNSTGDPSAIWNYILSPKQLQIKLQVQNYNGIGVDLINSHKFEEALQELRKAEEISFPLIKKYPHLLLPFSEVLAATKGNLGICYREYGHVDLSIEYIKEALQIYLSFQNVNPNAISNLYSSLGVCYQRKDMLKESIYYARKAANIVEGYSNQESYDCGATIYNLGVALALDKQFEEGLIYMRKGLSIWEKIFPEGYYLTNGAKNDIKAIEELKNKI